jgi:hypothetical protein
MASTRDIPTLVVEGNNDMHVIISLMRRDGINMDEGVRPIELKIAKDPSTKAEGVVPLLASMADFIRNATDRPIGFVLDVDLSCDKRWEEVCKCLTAAGITPPKSCPPDGYVGRMPGRSFDCGVWMMPDCVLDHGKLEHLLKTLVPADDPLWPLAELSTEAAKAKGAKFRDVDIIKATTHCWLAWQEEPGVPFGRAVTSNYFGHDSAEARAFLRWLRGLFNLDRLTNI